MNWSEAELFVKIAVTCTRSPNLYLVLLVRIASFQSEAVVDTLYNLLLGSSAAYMLPTGRAKAERTENKSALSGMVLISVSIVLFLLE